MMSRERATPRYGGPGNAGMSGKRQWQTGDMEADALIAVGKRSSKGSMMQNRTILSLSGNGIMKKMNFSRNRSRFPARRKSGGNAAKAIHGRQSFLPGATEADARTAGTAGWHREKTILHPGSRSSSKNGIMKKTGGSCRKTLHINPVKRSGGSVRKDIPGKLKSITGQRERGAGETDLATISPGLASEWDYGRNRGLSPEQVRPFSTRKVWWVCSRGHHWQCTVQIRQRGTGCPFCDGRIHRQSRLI